MEGASQSPFVADVPVTTSLYGGMEEKFASLTRKCLCCLEFLREKPSYIKLVDCTHEVCLECFNRWKRLKDTCPMCRASIVSVACFQIRSLADEKLLDKEDSPIGRIARDGEEYVQVYQEDFKFNKEKITEDDMDLACLDHSYFNEELDKLKRIIFDVKRERFERKGAQGTDYEWQVLEQIEIQLDHL
mmetsp:Transcript_4647/g.5552  ORF Transcript_4647/g.5552 Transcript_4647/m.5552 type:complete len:188 (-) Transcript_4647:397-960(-)